MTPNGLLLAYNTPSPIREIHAQAALISMSWKEQVAVKAEAHNNSNNDSASPNDDRQRSDVELLNTLTMELDKKNVLIRLLQPKLLLVLEGGVPPSKSVKAPQIVAEGPGDDVYPPAESGAQTKDELKENDKPSNSSIASSDIDTKATSKIKVRTKVLTLHRRKLDAMAKVIKSELDRVGFEMPSDPEDRFF